ncbi:MAG TPA: glycosyltransferase [Gemmatimonadaceae bacterium]|nr:glycosyltransferase [Gemmatimonadaceae bacterium]
MTDTGAAERRAATDGLRRTRLGRMAAGMRPAASQELVRIEPGTAPRSPYLLTIALEDYFHNFGHVIERSHWQRFETTVERGARRTLELLRSHDVKATFFAVGWIAEKMPELIRDIVAQGHEVASKGYDQRGVRELLPDAWRDDLARSRAAIERASGRRVLGYRSPGWLGRDDLWALEWLSKDGYLYDSSVKPIGYTFRQYGDLLGAGVKKFDGRELWEFPVASIGVAGFRFPIGTGNYSRQLPEWMMRMARAQWAWRSARDPYVMYFHTWELDPDQPQVTAISPVSRARFYRNIDRMEYILGNIFRTFRFTSIQNHLGVIEQPVVRSEPRPVQERPAPIRVFVEPGPGEPIRCSLVVPCFNEESSLVYLANTLDSLEEALAPKYAMEFVLVDDRSTDDTWRVMQQLFGDRGNYRLVRHEENSGPAVAILTGIRAASSDLVASIDCDCSYDPMELSKMLPMLEDDVSMVTASPYHPRGAVRNVPEWRLMLSRSLSLLYRMVLRQKLSTYTSCFRVYRRSAMLDMSLEHRGFLGVAEMLGKLDLAGMKIVEYPTTLSVRVLGYSKMKVARTITGHFKLLAALLKQRVSGKVRAAGDEPRSPRPA